MFCSDWRSMKTRQSTKTRFAPLVRNHFSVMQWWKCCRCPKRNAASEVANNQVMNRVAVRRNPMEIVDVALNLETDISKTLDAMRTAGQSVNEAGTGVRELTDLVQDALGNEESDFKRLVVEFREMSERAQVALDNFDRVFENINDIVGDEKLKGEIKESISSLPKIFEEVRVTVG